MLALSASFMRATDSLKRARSNQQFWLYVGLKFAMYVGWCAMGLFLVRRTVTIWNSLGFGFLRLAIGIAFGIAIFLVGEVMHLNPPAHPFAVYVSVYAPVRVVASSADISAAKAFN